MIVIVAVLKYIENKQLKRAFLYTAKYMFLKKDKGFWTFDINKSGLFGSPLQTN